MDIWKARIRTLRKRQAAEHWENVRRVAGHIAKEAREALADTADAKDSRRRHNAENLLRHAELLEHDPSRDVVDGVENWAWKFQASEKAGAGGKVSAPSNKFDTDEIVRLFDHYLEKGKQRRDITSMIARDIGATPRTIRTHLQYAGKIEKGK